MPRGTARAWLTTTDQALTSLTITSPLSNARVYSANIPVTWVFTANQDQYRAQIYSDAALTTLVFDSQWTVSALQSATLATGAALTSHAVYYLKLFAHGILGEEGESDAVPFYYALPTAYSVITGLSVRPEPNCAPTPFDLPGNRVQWNQAILGVGETFVAYEIQRRRAGIDTDYMRIARITTQTTTRYLDVNIVPGTEYEYLVLFYADDTAVTYLSLPTAPVHSRITFDWIYLHDTADFSRFFRVESFEGEVRSVVDVAYAQPFGQRRPAAFFGEAAYHSISLPGLERLRRTPRLWQSMETMLQRQQTNPSTLCVRFGLDRELYFVSFSQLTKKLSQRSYIEDISLVEVEYCEDIGLLVHEAV